MGGSRVGRRWVGWLLIVGWLAAGEAKTVRQMWSENPIAIVTSADELTRLNMQGALQGLKCRLLSPPEAIAERFGGEQIIWLVNRRELAFWPPLLLEKFPVQPASLPANQLVVNVWNKRSRPDDAWGWETLVIAPDHEQAMRALGQVLAVESGRYRDGPVLFNYRLEDAVVVATQAQPVAAWLERQESAARQFRTKVVAPAAIAADQLAAATVVALVLTHADWQKLDEAPRAALAPYLTDEMRQSLNGEVPSPRVYSAVRQVDGKTCAVAVAPSERFLKGIYPPDGSPITKLRWPGLEAAHAAEVSLADLRATPRLLLVAEPTQAREQQQPLQELLEAVAAELTQLGFDVTTPNQMQMAQHLDDLQSALDGGRAPSGSPDAFDAMAVLRIATLSGETRQEAGEPECLTSPPDTFDRPEPRRPDPQDRKPGIRRGHLYEPHYPNGVPCPGGADELRENDPAYQRDLRRYNNELLPAYERAKREHERREETMPVDWRLTVTTVREVQLRASLRLLRQDENLVTLELAGEAEHRDVDVQQETTRGWGSRPRRPSLQPTRREIDDRLIPGAARQAAGRVGHLGDTALVPKDEGRAGSRHDAPVQAAARRESEPTGPATTALELATRVEVTAVGSLADGEAVAEQRASLVARQQAVQEVIGEYLPPGTVTAKAAVIDEAVLPNAPALARVVETLGREVKGDALELTYLVEVDRPPLRQQLLALGLLRRWRVMIVVPEELRPRVVPDPAAENALMRHFIAAEFPVIDAQHSAMLRANREELEKLRSGSPQALAAIRQQFGAEILVTGEAFAEEFQNPMIPDAQLCRARLEVKAIDLTTAEVLAAYDEHQTGRDATVELASKVAFRNCADQIAERLIETICRRPMPKAGLARVELQLAGFDGYTGVGYFVQALEAMEGVREVKLGEYQAETGARIEVQLDLEQERSLPMWLETHEWFKPFQVKVTSANPSQITARVGATPEAPTVKVKAPLAPTQPPPTEDSTPPPAQTVVEEPAPGAPVDSGPPGDDEATEPPDSVPPAQVRPAASEPEPDEAAAEPGPPPQVETVALDGRAINLRGVGMVPFKEVFEWLGIQYEWRARTKAIVADWETGAKSYHFVIRIGERFVDLDGDRLALPAAPVVRDGVTYVPAKLLVGLLGTDLNWDEDARLVTITYGYRAATLPIR